MMRRVHTIVTAPATTPISVSEAKSHMNVTFSDDDTLIGIYVNSATALCEQILQRKLITQTWKMYLDHWPAYIKVLFGNLQSVTHIKYTDTDGDQETFSSDYYDVDTNSVPGRINLKYAQTWPSATLNATNPIEIQFVTGYGASSTDIPADIRNAILLTTAHFYENRENQIVSNVQSMTIEDIPWTSAALLANHRVWDWIV